MSNHPHCSMCQFIMLLVCGYTFCKLISTSSFNRSTINITYHHRPSHQFHHVNNIFHSPEPLRRQSSFYMNHTANILVSVEMAPTNITMNNAGMAQLSGKKNTSVFALCDTKSVQICYHICWYMSLKTYNNVIQWPPVQANYTTRDILQCGRTVK